MSGSRSQPADACASDPAGAASAASFSHGSRHHEELAAEAAPTRSRARVRKHPGRDAVSSASSRKGPPRVTTSILLPAILVAALLAWAVMLFNRLVRLRNQVRPAWADIDVQLTRRHDLVPSLVAAVKGSAGPEAAPAQEATTPAAMQYRRHLRERDRHA